MIEKRKPGRPLGSRNKSTPEFRATVAALDRAGKIDLKGLILSLYADATSDNPAIRIPARREFQNRYYGLPHVDVGVTTTHELGPTIVELLAHIHQSDQHRRALEELETMRRRALPSAVVEDESFDDQKTSADAAS